MRLMRASKVKSASSQHESLTLARSPAAKPPVPCRFWFARATAAATAAVEGPEVEELETGEGV